MKQSELRKLIQEEIANILNKDVLSKESELLLDKVKMENPNQLGRFRSLIKNRGLEVAKERYKEIDPEVIKLKKKQLSKEKSKETKKKWYDKNKEKINLQKLERIKKQREEESEEDKMFYQGLKIFSNKKELARKFVYFLPNDFPEQVEKLMNKLNTGFDSAFYVLLGAYMPKFEKQFNLSIPSPTEDEEFYENELYTMLYGKYGDTIEF